MVLFYTVLHNLRIVSDLLSCFVYVDAMSTIQIFYLVTCPPGTSVLQNKCEFCMRGTFQPFKGQLRCIFCTTGFTTPSIGSYHEMQCGNTFISIEYPSYIINKLINLYTNFKLRFN
jgi:hypothetical protein